MHSMHAEMRLLAYRSVPLSVLCVFWKSEVRERLGLKIGGELRSFASYGTLTTVGKSQCLALYLLFTG